MKEMKPHNVQRPPTIAVDLDGVICDYSKGWRGVGNFGSVLPDAKEKMQQLKKEGWHIVIFTCRAEHALIADFLRREGIPFDQINKNENIPGEVPGYGLEKVIADVYLDDRAIHFDGDWNHALRDIHRLMDENGQLGFIKE